VNLLELMRCPQHQGEHTLQVWDMSGQERFHELAMTYVIKAAVIIFVYDVCHRSSLLELTEHWLPAVNKAITGLSTKPVLHLVGTKVDLADRHREVTQEEAIEVAGKFDITHYGECSAKDGDGVPHLLSLMTGGEVVPFEMEAMIELPSGIRSKTIVTSSLFTCCCSRTRRRYVELEPK
jgi:GTPase SAR1 family protein